MITILKPQCTRLQHSFSAMDKFLLPVDAAYIAERISSVEFGAIKNQVEVLFDDLKHSLEELPSHSKVAK